MKVFITWSGARSRAVAEAVRNWLPNVLQRVEPYFTPADVDKGTRWQAEISRELNDSNTGLLFITRDNCAEPWLVFEAGALGKNLGDARVFPVLLDLTPADLKPPLSMFQAAVFEKEDFKRVIRSLDESVLEGKLGNESFNSAFEKWWPDLEKDTHGKLVTTDDSPGPARGDRELLEEILRLSRSVATTVSGGRAVLELERSNIALVVDAYMRLVYGARDLGIDPGVGRRLYELGRLLESLVQPYLNVSSRALLNGEVESLLKIGIYERDARGHTEATEPEPF